MKYNPTVSAQYSPIDRTKADFSLSIQRIWIGIYIAQPAACLSGRLTGLPGTAVQASF
jgi:hypothetical protein